MEKVTSALQLILRNPWEYALVGMLPIVIYLVVTGHATLGPVNPGKGESGCFDDRVDTDVEVFGGSAGYTFGWYYFVASLLAFVFGYRLLSGFLTVYGIFNLILSLVQVPLYLLQARKAENFTGLLKAHYDGCGWTTSMSVIWIIFWPTEIPLVGKYFRWLIPIRDLITLIDFWASKPAVYLILSPLTMKYFGVPTTGVIQHVERPRSKH